MSHLPHDHRDLHRDPFEKKLGYRERPDASEPPGSAPAPDTAAFQDPDFEAPESDSLRKLIRHIVDEMPGHVIVAVTLVAFMFFYGMANSFFKLTGRDIASIEFPFGVVTGAVGSLSLTLAILLVKYRKK